MDSFTKPETHNKMGKLKPNTRQRPERRPPAFTPGIPGNLPFRKRTPRQNHVVSSSLPYTKIGPIQNVSKIAIGTWSWGNRVLFDYDPSHDAELERAFEEAITRGVSLFDTADSYGTGRLNGRAEKLLGDFMRKNASITSDIKIATKYASYPWRLTRKSIVNAAARSAERLGRPADVGQIHWSASSYAPWQERVLWDGLADAMEQGFCQEIGVSNFGPKALERMDKYLRQERGVRLASAQVQVSLLSRQHVQAGGLCEVAERLGVGVIGYSPLCLGLLSGKYGEGRWPGGPRGVLFERLKPRVLLPCLERIARRRGVSPAQIAVAWCASKNIVVLVGARTFEQVNESLVAAELQLADEEIVELENAAAQGRQMLQNIFQTK